MTDDHETKVIRTVCRECRAGCGMLVHVKKGRAIKLEIDPNAPMAGDELCWKSQAGLERLYHPDRLCFPLKRTGRLLKLLGESEKWGCTNRLIVTDLYQCVRHPHHIGMGIFMLSLGLLIGHRWSFLLITIPQWLWILGFLFLVEERELLEKFGEEYEAYRQQVPMFFPNPLCASRILSAPIEMTKEEAV